ncbi:MAG TPA: hypothetical protein VK936_07315 [Longimicrobiales bacterium]|nr:hypothetical protein [Longimicrobiales bacterium]
MKPWDDDEADHDGPLEIADDAAADDDEPGKTRPSLIARNADGPRPEDQRIDPTARPGWVKGNVREPRVGDEVFCTAGAGTVLRIHGRTGNGSRLLEVRLANSAKAPFFVASSNVLVPPETAVDGGDGAEG